METTSPYLFLVLVLLFSVSGVCATVDNSEDDFEENNQRVDAEQDPYTKVTLAPKPGDATSTLFRSCLESSRTFDAKFASIETPGGIEYIRYVPDSSITLANPVTWVNAVGRVSDIFGCTSEAEAGGYSMFKYSANGCRLARRGYDLGAVPACEGNEEDAVFIKFVAVSSTHALITAASTLPMSTTGGWTTTTSVSSTHALTTAASTLPMSTAGGWTTTTFPNCCPFPRVLLGTTCDGTCLTVVRSYKNQAGAISDCIEGDGPLFSPDNPGQIPLMKAYLLEIGCGATCIPGDCYWTDARLVAGVWHWGEGTGRPILASEWGTQPSTTSPDECACLDPVAGLKQYSCTGPGLPICVEPAPWCP